MSDSPPVVVNRNSVPKLGEGVPTAAAVAFADARSVSEKYILERARLANDALHASEKTCEALSKSKIVGRWARASVNTMKAVAEAEVQKAQVAKEAAEASHLAVRYWMKAGIHAKVSAAQREAEEAQTIFFR